MVGHDQRDALIGVHTAPEPADGLLFPGEELGGEGADGEEGFRAPRARVASSGKGEHASISCGERVPVPGRTALENVADVDGVLPRQVHARQEQVEELARGPHEGEAGGVLVGAGSLSHHHQAGVHRAVGEKTTCVRVSASPQRVHARAVSRSSA